MSSAAFIQLAVKVSLALLVLGVGFHSSWRDMTSLLRQRALLFRSFLSVSVITPLIALSLVRVFALQPAVALALVALALSPLPPLLPNKVVRTGGAGSYAIGLLVAAALGAIVIVPATVWLLGVVHAVRWQMRATTIAKLMGVSVLLPLSVGVCIRRFAPALAERAAKPVQIISMALLCVALLPILVKAWPTMRSLIGNGTLTAIVAITLIGLAVGHALGGPDDDNRTVLALATVSRHPAVAMAIITATFPDQKAAPAAVLLALLASAIASVPYSAWRKRQSRMQTARVPV